MKLGCIFTSYGMADYLFRSLGPWIEFRKNHDVKIAAVSLPFKDCELQDDDTQNWLRHYLAQNQIDDLFTEPLCLLPEWKARDLALQALLKDGCDMICLADGDEFWNIENNILPSLTFIEAQPFIAWFKASYKNYIWDERHYLAEPFTPPRWYRAKYGDFSLSHFTYDNDVAYKDSQGGIKPHLMMPHMTIPASVSFTPHWTWLDNENSRRKIEYQTKARGWQCSYRWDEEKKHVEFNLDFYRKTGQNVPEVREET